MNVPASPITVQAPAAGPDVRRVYTIFARRARVALLVFAALLVVECLLVFSVAPSYRATASLLVPVPTNNRAVRVEGGDLVNELERVAAVQPPSVAAQVDEMKSPAFIRMAMERAGIDPEREARNFAVKVETPEFVASDTIRVTAEGTQPKRVAVLANRVAELHIRGIESRHTEALARAVEYLRREREQAGMSLAQVESRLAALPLTQQLQQLTAEREPRAQQLVQLESQVEERRRSAMSAGAMLQALRSRLATEPSQITVPQIQPNPQHLQLADQLRQLYVQRLQLLQDFQPSAPEVQAVDEQIAAFKKQLAKQPVTLTARNLLMNPRVEVIRSEMARLEMARIADQQAFQAAQRDLSSRKSRYTQQISTAAQLAGTREALAQTRTRTLDRYNLLSDRLQALEVRRTAQVQAGRVLSRAVAPTSAVVPDRPVMLGVLLLATLVLALGAPFLAHYLDNRVYETEEVETLSRLPTLAHVPALGSRKARLLAQLPSDSPGVEAYRTLRASIGLLSRQRPIRRLQVTSTVFGEGRTLTAANLATALAMEGRRVVLVDADLRRPGVDTLLDLNREPGLCELLTGVATVEEALQPTAVQRLWALPAGAVTAAAIEQLGTSALDTLLDRLELQADVIILDTPPCLPVADPMVLASRMDAVLLVVRMGVTQKGDIVHAVDLLERAGAHVVGTVVNQAQLNRHGYYSPNLLSRDTHAARPTLHRTPEAGFAAAHEQVA